MIYVDINGQCGNQFFQYAFARKLSIIYNNPSILIDFNRIKAYLTRVGSKNKYNSLEDFNVIPFKEIDCSGDCISSCGSKKQKRLYNNYPFMRKMDRHFHRFFSLQKYQKLMQKNGIFKEDGSIISFPPIKENNLFVRGYFENPVFFSDIKKVLMDEFQPKYPKKDKNKELYNLIEQNESVCVSFKSWNNLSNNSKELSRRDVCTETYYRNAIDLITKMIPNALLIVFSNNIKWVKENFSFPKNTIFEDGTDEVWEKLRLMYSCKHFIMSTSTFCWWAQFLSKNDKKIVISPKEWYADGTKSFLLEDSWIKVDR